MDYKQLILKQTLDFAKKELTGKESGHDWWHAYRVHNNAKKIAQNEKCNLLVVELASLLHDIADSKFYNGNEDIGPKKAANFMFSIKVDNETCEHVISIIKNMSFKGGMRQSTFKSVEFDIVQDADRLDAIGAIGIARAFSYGGFKKREFYNPDILPVLNMTPDQYKNSTAPTINHFYEKLLLLKDKMNTKSGKIIAEERHNFMLNFLDHFYNEWNESTT